MKIVKIFSILIFIFTNVVFAQFGKNKVHTKDFDWNYIQTKHFDIYFANNGETLTEFTAQSAEEAIASIQKTFNYRVNSRITIIVYNSQNDFQETNVIDEYLSEGIQGFTELFKNRVVIQYTGSYKQFRHLIHHELVHAVMNDMFYGGSIQNIITNNISLQFPIWFNEGLAEYESLGWDVDSDMFIRDAAISEYLPDIERLDGYFAYRGGQSVFYYIANKFGKEKIGELLNKIKGVGNVEEGFKATLGIDIKELGKRWKEQVKIDYWPDIAIYKSANTFAKKLTDYEKGDGFYNTSPAISPQGDKIVFISNRDFYFDVYIMDAHNGKILDKLVEGSRTPEFEELNILTPGLTWSPDGKKVALSAKSSGYDVIHIIDIDTKDEEVLPINLQAIHSVTWSNDGKFLAFVGQNDKQSDIYLYDFADGKSVNLTNDIFSDSDPSWSIDNKAIYFSSDQGSLPNDIKTETYFKMVENGESQRDIFKYELDNKKKTRITDLPYSDESSAKEEADGNNLMFISDLNGINNIYIKSLQKRDSTNSILNNTIKPITNSLSGIYQLSLSKDSKKLAFSSLHNAAFTIFLMNNPFESKTELDTLKPTLFITEQIEQRDKKDDELIKSSLNKNVVLQNAEGDTNKIKIFTGSVLEQDSLENNKRDFSNFVFGASDTTNQMVFANDSLFMPKDNLDKNGNYLVHPYKINFSTDLIYANAGYSTFYGLLGSTIITFSDVLGDYRIIGVTGLQIDLKNSDYGLAFYSLGGRINYGIQGFHTARFVNLIKDNFINLYRFRNYGISLTASLPLNRFYRFDAGLSWINVLSENLDDFTLPESQTSFLVPSLGFVHDNVLWGYTSPIEGTRYRLEAYGNPGIGNSRLGFYTFTGDYRTYLRFWTDYSFVIRFSGGYSGGPNAQRFFLGGIENWINRSFATSEIPIESNSDYAFLTAVLPLRGFDYSQQIGSKYLLMNYELRFPLIRYLVTGGLPLLFSNILGVAFIDAGTAWNNTSKVQLLGRNVNGSVVTKDLLMGTGVGARVFFFNFLLRFDVAWAYDLDHFTKPKFYFSLGADF